MSLKYLRFSLILIGLLASAGLCLGQTGSITGKVIDSAGQPMKDALIKIERMDIRGNYKVKTKKKGNYFHAGLPLGRYIVTLEIDGSMVDRVSGVRIAMGDPTEVSFDLVKTEAAKKTGPFRLWAVRGSDPRDNRPPPPACSDPEKWLRR